MALVPHLYDNDLTKLIVFGEMVPLSLVYSTWLR